MSKDWEADTAEIWRHIAVMEEAKVAYDGPTMTTDDLAVFAGDVRAFLSGVFGHCPAEGLVALLGRRV